MTHTVPRLLAIAALGLAATALAQEVSFGIIATDAASTQRERWEPFFRDMEKKTGLTIKSFYAPDYAGVIEAMRFNKVQVAWMGNKSAMEAVDRANGEIFAQIMYADGTYGYHGLLITHKDSRTRRWTMCSEREVDRLRHRRSNSTSGSWCPRSISSRSVSTIARPSRPRATPATAPTCRLCWPNRWMWPPTTPKT
jgi:phosphate/phosphite/phosphonate ABC transporter binding protein